MHISHFWRALIVVCFVLHNVDCKNKPITKRDVRIVTNNPACTKMAAEYVEHYPEITSVELFIVTSVCEGIVHPMDSGLGGGFQMVIHHHVGPTASRTRYINAREKSGKNHVFATAAGSSPKHIGVPSMLAGYQYIYNNAKQLCGRKAAVPWKMLFKKNIELAQKG